MAQQTFEELVAAVKQAESRDKRYKDDGKTLTTSAKGALGEMQVMPKTIKDPGFGVTPAKDKSPDEIARVGVDYLQAMKQKYGDTEKALIAYNWGPGSTDKWLAAGADPKKLPAETKTYVERVKGFLGGNVPRETSVAKKEREPLPPSLPPMAQAPTIKPEAAARVASLGPGYQAALALSFLAETDDEEDRKTTITQEYLAKAQEEEDDRAASAAIAKRQSNVFADLSNTTIRSPFAEPQQPVMMKDGGDVGDRLTPQQIEQYVGQKTKAQLLLEKFKEQAHPRNYTSIIGLGPNIVYETYKYATGKDPLRDLQKELQKKIDYEVDTGSEPIGTDSGPISGSLPPIRRAEGSPEEGERLTPQQIERIAAQGPTERKDEPFFDAASRTYVDVLTGRREPITAKDFTAREQMAMMDAVRRSQARGGEGRVDYEDYPDSNTAGPGYVDIRNTLGGFKYKQGLDGSTIITDKYDFHGPRVAEYEKMGSGERLVKSAKNALIELVKSGGPRDLAGELGRAYVGSKGPDVNIRIPVNRAEGSPEEGEVAPRLTMQQIERLAAQEATEREAASTPAFIAQKSGIGRKAGPVSQALQSGQGYVEAAKGFTMLPQNLVGGAFDISNMIANVYGGGVEKPIFGSENLKEQSRKAGLAFKPSDDPTLAAFFGAGDLGSNLVNPAGVTRSGVKAAQKTGEAIKGKASDLLAKFQELKTAKPSITDLMTGQRVEAPELTPQQLQEFENWRSMSQEQLRAQNIAQRDEAVTRLPQDAQQQLRLFEENAMPPPVEQPLNNPPGWNIVDTGVEAAPVLEAAAPVAAQARTMAELPVVTPVAPPVAVPVSAEFPFVGRLDEFAAGMKGPAQKEQLINQVKGKFREQDVLRLEEALSGLGPKDKVTPAMLQDALANTYSPSRLRSMDELAGQGKPMYSNMDNVFAPDKPISGSMNLYIKQTPETEALAKDATELRLALNSVFNNNAQPSIFDTIDNLLTNSPITARLPNIKELQQQLAASRPVYERFHNIEKEIIDAKQMLTYPAISGDQAFGRPLLEIAEERVKAAIQEGMNAGRIPNNPYYGIPKDQLTTQQRIDNFPMENSLYSIEKQIREEELAKLFVEVMQKGSDKLAKFGLDPVDITAAIDKLSVKPTQNIFQANTELSTNIQFNEEVASKVKAIKDSVKAGQQKVQDRMRNKYEVAIQELNPLMGYRGQHTGVAEEILPVGFARYTEHAVNMNGKQLNGRHVHELQSDLAQDVRQLGSKSGSLEKDQAELATVQSKFAEIDERDPTQKIEKAKLKKRVTALEKRILSTSPDRYQLDQPFAGFETSPAVEMQLLIKNAIQSTMRSGQDFVTFPGKESSQAKLYEKLLPNLKQAVKDLGGEKAGFDIKPITLPNPSGDSPTVWGVVWSPETATKIMQKGVPFNKGGMVERKADDNRRYM